MLVENLINKEDIAGLKIINAPEDKTQEWHEKLNYAVRLGNEFKSKTSITFMTENGERTVDTTVWSLTEKYIQLKGGILIPLKSITNIHY